MANASGSPRLMVRRFLICVAFLGAAEPQQTVRASLQSFSFTGTVTYNEYGVAGLLLPGDVPVGTPVSGTVVYDNAAPPLPFSTPTYLTQSQVPPAFMSVTFASAIPHVITTNNDWLSTYFDDPNGDLATFHEAASLIDETPSDVQMAIEFDGPTSVFTSLSMGPSASQITSNLWDYQFGYLFYSSDELHFSITFVPEPVTLGLWASSLLIARRRRH